jgi:NCS1 family nucleobase:cation symporter-1
LGPILAQPSKFSDNAQFFQFFFPALTGMVGFWATLSLNIPDFTRYARSQHAQATGQAVALPSSMTLFSFIGVVVTSATTIVYGSTIWDPLILAGKFESKFLVSMAMIAVAISTLATNIAANIVSPANDFANLAPGKISFRTGGLVTGLIGIAIFPWKLVADPGGYIFTWLVGYSSLLGPIGGIMIVDYYFIRKQKLEVDQLYRRRAPTVLGMALIVGRSQLCYLESFQMYPAFWPRSGCWRLIPFHPGSFIYTIMPGLWGSL